MVIGRRSVIKLLAASALWVSGFSNLFRSTAWGQFGPRLALRKVGESDAADLAEIMNACVSDADSFHGKCDPWALRWAELLVRRRPETVVITLDGVPVAFSEVPSIHSPSEAPKEDASGEEWAKYELRERGRKTFRLTAVGVRTDLLSPAEAVQTFRRVLYYGIKKAREIGFEHLECVVPWEHHPKMPRAWTDYPGCELVAHSRNQDGGNDAYWLRCSLDEAIEALALEGADDEALDRI